MPDTYEGLSEPGVKEAEKIIEAFKEKLSIAAEQAISDLYINIGEYIESDSWTNYQNYLMDGLKGYKKSGRWDWDSVREKIFTDHREEIIKDLNQDLLKEIERLKASVKYLEERQRNF